MKSHTQTQKIIGMVALIMLGGGIGGFVISTEQPRAKALSYQNTVTPTFNINSACTVASAYNAGNYNSTQGAYIKEITPGNYATEVGGSTFTITCNGSSTTWSVTAVGYTGDVAGTTGLTGTAGTIATAANTATSGATSSWQMRVTGTGATNRTSYGAVSASTSPELTVATGTASSTLTAQYYVYVGTAQASGSYTGKVRYTIANVL